jgi:hypothetical protein
LEGSFFDEHLIADIEMQRKITAKDRRIMQFTKRQLVRIAFSDSINFAAQKTNYFKKLQA